MARQFVIVVALVLLATVAFAADDTKPKASLPTFAEVPLSAAGPATDSSEVGTVGGAGDTAGAPAADTVSAAPVGGPVADGAFGGDAESPKSGAAQVSAVTGVAFATIAASLLF